ncbi:questin oxidase family protein [Kaistia nematophila]|uniref:Questin oxidase family protein n=1 Tax=Kaistia nematophila TaxID=2994654 RepID=A0A9X3IM55_9HYPH|nr:questin oxidase family protein [Kaistia nematophila]MCX5569525.1 questin oxidase family protein [Kaistia nematophila]
MALSPRTEPDTVDELLVEVRLFSAEFPVLLANHLPMIIVALDRLGASSERLREYFETYRTTNGLVPTPPPVAPIQRDRWTDALGDRTREYDYRAFFEAEVRRIGIDSAIQTYLPTLIPGIGASATHGMMRTAYGLMRMDPTEVGTALGYWSTTYLSMPRATGATPTTDDPGQVLARACGLADLHQIEAETDLLWHNIRAAGEKPDFAPVVDWLEIGPDTGRRLAATSLALFAATMDFSALHALTGSHWIRLIGPHLDEADRPALQRYFWQIIASLVPKIGFPSLPSAEQLDEWRHLPAPGWPEIAAVATQSDDEHDISLVFSAREEEAVYGDRLYRVVAARRMGLIA